MELSAVTEGGLSVAPMEGVFLAIVIAVCVVGAYYQLQVLAHSKPGMLSRVWLGGWIWHPEYLEQGGLPYRKKLLVSMAIFLLLTAGSTLVFDAGC